MHWITSKRDIITHIKRIRRILISNSIRILSSYPVVLSPAS
jgi:hypothetical protein